MRLPGVFSGHCRSAVTRKILLLLLFWLDHETSDSDSFINNLVGCTVTRQAHVGEVDAATGLFGWFMIRLFCSMPVPIVM